MASPTKEAMKIIEGVIYLRGIHPIEKMAKQLNQSTIDMIPLTQLMNLDKNQNPVHVFEMDHVK